MLMMRPYPAFAMVLPKIWQARSVPVRLVSITRDHSSSLSSRVGALWVTPAALTRISTLPNSFSTASCSCLDRRAVQHVAGDAHRVRRPQLLNLRRNTAHLLQPPRTGHNIRARIGQAQRNAMTQPGGSTGHHRNSATQIKKTSQRALLACQVQLRHFTRPRLAPVIRASRPAREIYHVRRFTCGAIPALPLARNAIECQ